MEQGETEITRPLLAEGSVGGTSMVGLAIGKTWKVFCALHFAVVLIVGIALEAVRVTGRGCADSSSMTQLMKSRGALRGSPFLMELCSSTTREAKTTKNSRDRHSKTVKTQQIYFLP